MKKKRVIIGALCVALIVGVFTFIGYNRSNSEGYVCIDINPSVELVVNHKDKVTQANALNTDAEIVLSGISLVGMNMTDAVELFVESATELGYLDVDATEEDPNAVLITTMAFNGSRAKAIKAKMLNRIDSYFLENGIWGIAWSDEDLGNMIQEAEDLGISAGKYRLIKSVQISHPEKTIEELKNMSIKGLINLVKEKRPVDTLVNNYTMRKEYLESLDTLTTEEQTEFDEINAKLDNIEELKAMVAADKAQLKENARTRYEEFKANRQSRVQARRARWQIFRANHPTLASEIAQRFIDNFGGKLNR